MKKLLWLPLLALILIGGTQRVDYYPKLHGLRIDSTGANVVAHITAVNGDTLYISFLSDTTCAMIFPYNDSLAYLECGSLDTIVIGGGGGGGETDTLDGGWAWDVATGFDLVQDSLGTRKAVRGLVEGSNITLSYTAGNDSGIVIAATGGGFSSVSADTTDNGTPDLISTDSIALRAGTNINFSWTNGSNERELTISGPAGSGTQDSIGWDTTGNGVIDFYTYPSYVLEGQNMIFEQVGEDSLRLNAADSVGYALLADSAKKVDTSYAPLQELIGDSVGNYLPLAGGTMTDANSDINMNSADIDAVSAITADSVVADSAFIGVTPVDEAVLTVATTKPGFLGGASAEPDAHFGNATEGMIEIGDGQIAYGADTTYNTGLLDLDGSMVFRQTATPSRWIEFMFAESGNTPRFVLPTSGDSLGTLNPRSMFLAGPAVLNDSIVRFNYWGFTRIDANTSGTGADLGVQDDIEALGYLYVDTISAIVNAGTGDRITFLDTLDGVIDKAVAADSSAKTDTTVAAFRKMIDSTALNDTLENYPTWDFVGTPILYQFSVSTSDGDPGNGVMRYDNATQAVSTQIFADDLDVGVGWTVDSLVSSLDNGFFLYIVELRDPLTTFHIWTLDAATTNATGYNKINLGTFVDGAGSFADNDTLVLRIAYNPKFIIADSLDEYSLTTAIVLRDGTQAMTANWGFGNFDLTGGDSTDWTAGFFDRLFVNSGTRPLQLPKTGPTADGQVLTVDTITGGTDTTYWATGGGGETDTLDGGWVWNATTGFEMVQDSLGTRKAVRGLVEGTGITLAYTTGTDSGIVITSTGGSPWDETESGTDTSMAYVTDNSDTAFYISKLATKDTTEVSASTTLGLLADYVGDPSGTGNIQFWTEDSVRYTFTDSSITPGQYAGGDSSKQFLGLSGSPWAAAYITQQYMYKDAGTDSWMPYPTSAPSNNQALSYTSTGDSLYWQTVSGSGTVDTTFIDADGGGGAPTDTIVNDPYLAQGQNINLVVAGDTTTINAVDSVTHATIADSAKKVDTAYLPFELYLPLAGGTMNSGADIGNLATLSGDSLRINADSINADTGFVSKLVADSLRMNNWIDADSLNTDHFVANTSVSFPSGAIIDSAITARNADDADTLIGPGSGYTYINSADRLVTWLSNTMDIGDTVGTDNVWKDIFMGGAINMIGGGSSDILGVDSLAATRYTDATVDAADLTLMTKVELEDRVSDVNSGSGGFAISYGDIYSGTHNFANATALRVPTATAPTTSAEGDFAWDNDDDAIEVFSGDEAASVLIPIYYPIRATIVDPSGLAAGNDTLELAHFDAIRCPAGVTIQEISYSARVAPNDSIVIAYTSGPTYATPSVVDTIRMTSTSGDAPSLDNVTPPADGYLWVRWIDKDQTGNLHLTIYYTVDPN